jgi:hypothetical protein
MRRRLLVALALGLPWLLLAWHFVSYALLADARIASIARSGIARCTLADPDRNEWVLIDRCRGLDESQMDALREVLRRRYGNVYESEDALPPLASQFNNGGNWLCYQRGIAFRMSVFERSRFKVRVWMGARAGDEGTRYAESIYIWFFGFWVHLRDNKVLVS